MDKSTEGFKVSRPKYPASGKPQTKALKFLFKGLPDLNTMPQSVTCPLFSFSLHFNLKKNHWLETDCYRGNPSTTCKHIVQAETCKHTVQAETCKHTVQTETFKHTVQAETCGTEDGETRAYIWHRMTPVKGSMSSAAPVGVSLACIQERREKRRRKNINKFQPLQKNTNPKQMKRPLNIQNTLYVWLAMITKPTVISDESIHIKTICMIASPSHFWLFRVTSSARTP